MNKQDLINAVAEENSISRSAAEVAVNGVFDAIHEAMIRGAEVRITGFGTFKRVATKARTCRNPHNGETVEVPAGHKVKFKASDKLKVTP